MHPQGPVAPGEAILPPIPKHFTLGAENGTLTVYNSIAVLEESLFWFLNKHLDLPFKRLTKKVVRIRSKTENIFQKTSPQPSFSSRNSFFTQLYFQTSC